MWTWDSTQITFDQTCWTFDGSNGCGGSPGVPSGPTEPEAVGKPGSGSGKKPYREAGWRESQLQQKLPSSDRREAILREDNDIVDFIMTVLTKGIM